MLLSDIKKRGRRGKTEVLGQTEVLRKPLLLLMSPGLFYFKRTDKHLPVAAPETLPNTSGNTQREGMNIYLPLLKVTIKP